MQTIAATIAVRMCCVEEFVALYTDVYIYVYKCMCVRM